MLLQSGVVVQYSTDMPHQENSQEGFYVIAEWCTVKVQYTTDIPYEENSQQGFYVIAEWCTLSSRSIVYY